MRAAGGSSLADDNAASDAEWAGWRALQLIYEMEGWQTACFRLVMCNL